MRSLSVRAGILLVAVVVPVCGIFGAYGYARDYSLHRGFSTLVPLPRAGTGRLLNVRFYSRALRRNARYLVYLPPGYTAAKRYPVYYLLHGMPGQPSVFVNIANMDVRLDNQMSLGRARAMILVYPDGRIGGSVFSDSEWANTPSGQLETYVIEVMHNVDRRFATLPHRQDRVIAGFSAGAYGAINVALHHLGDFANVQAWSGYFTQARTGVFAHATPAQIAYNSPLDYVGRLSGAIAAHPLRAYLFVGRDDSASLQQLAMVRALLVHGAHAQYRLYPGGHDWSVWYPRLNHMLDLASWDLTHPPAAPLHAGQRRRAMVGLPGYSLSTRVSLASRLATAVPGTRSHPVATTTRRLSRSKLRLLGALLLALVSTVLINIGFVLQHRGHSRARAPERARLIDGFRNRHWLGGQVLGWMGFAGQIVAVALAPLTLVQAFTAGSLAISVPLAGRLFGYRVRRDQLVAIGVITVSLASLPIGFAGGHGHLHAGAMIAAAMVASLGAVLLGLRGRTATRAIAAGVFYGVADAAIKADALALRAHGPGALVSGWTILATLSTFGGFLAFQAALRDKETVQSLSLMSGFTAVTAIALGIGGFGETLGASPAASIGHAVAIALVLGSARPLARTQQQLAHAASSSASPVGVDGVVIAEDPRLLTAQTPNRPAEILRSTIRKLLAGAGAILAVLICSLAGIGLLYTLRSLGWLTAGPQIPDALPLLQLAGFDGQPLARVVAAWFTAGLVLGIALVRVCPPRRMFFAGLLAAALLLSASDASYALTHNLRLGQVLLNHEPGLGAWTEALLLAAACALPRPIQGAHSLAFTRPPPSRSLSLAGRLSPMTTKAQ